MIRQSKDCMDPLLAQLLQRIEDATFGMSPEQLLWRPREGKWCATQVAEHLSLTYFGTAGVMRRILQAAKPLATPPSMRHRISTFLVVSMGHMPEGRKAPAFTMPTDTSPEIVLRDFRQNLRTMDEVLAECEQRFGARVKIADHPVLGALTVAQWRKFHFVHGRHHARQIERLRDMLARVDKPRRAPFQMPKS
jgi:hypothetical protein